MGVALEIGKLSAVAWFSQGRGSRLLRTALCALVAILMTLNAIGAYGFLARAHIAQSLNGELVLRWGGAEIGAKIEAQRAEIRRISQIDDAVSAATRRGRTGSAIDLANAQRKNREALGKDRAAAMEGLTALQVEAASVDGQRKLAAADLGPALYLATLLGVEPDVMLRWFVLLVAVLLDPAAVLLLMEQRRPGACEPSAVRQLLTVVFPERSGGGQGMGLFDELTAKDTLKLGELRGPEINAGVARGVLADIEAVGGFQKLRRKRRSMKVNSPDAERFIGRNVGTPNGDFTYVLDFIGGRDRG